MNYSLQDARGYPKGHCINLAGSWLKDGEPPCLFSPEGFCHEHVAFIIISVAGCPCG